MWQPTDELALIWCDKPLGRVTNLSGDQPWMHADFARNADAVELRPFFDACTDEDNPPPDIDSIFDASQRNRAPDTYEWYRYRLECLCRRHSTMVAERLKPFHVEDWVNSYELSVTSRRNYFRSAKRC